MNRTVRASFALIAVFLPALLLSPFWPSTQIHANSSGADFPARTAAWLQLDAPEVGGKRWVNLDRVDSFLFYKARDNTDCAMVQAGRSSALVTNAQQLQAIRDYLKQRAGNE